MEYEICYLIGESRELDLESIKKGVEKIVIEKGGDFLEGEFQEKRKMAYEIQKEIRGTYVARRFSVPNKDEREKKQYPGKDIVSEITKEMNLNNDVLRFVIVKSDDLPELREGGELSAAKKDEVKADDSKSKVKKERVVESKVESKKSEKKDESKKKAESKEEEVEDKKVEEKKEELVETKDESPKSKDDDVKEKKVEKKKEEKKKESAEDFDKKLDEIIKI